MNFHEDAMSAYLARLSEEPHPIPVARDPRNPAEDEMTDDDNENYEQEKRT